MIAELHYGAGGGAGGGVGVGSGVGVGVGVGVGSGVGVGVGSGVGVGVGSGVGFGVGVGLGGGVDTGVGEGFVVLSVVLPPVAAEVPVDCPPPVWLVLELEVLPLPETADNTLPVSLVGGEADCALPEEPELESVLACWPFGLVRSTTMPTIPSTLTTAPAATNRQAILRRLERCRSSIIAWLSATYDLASSSCIACKSWGVMCRRCVA